VSWGLTLLRSLPIRFPAADSNSLQSGRKRTTPKVARSGLVLRRVGPRESPIQFLYSIKHRLARACARNATKPRDLLVCCPALFMYGALAYVYGATLHFSVSHGLLLQVRVFFRVLDRAHQHRQGVLPEIRKNLQLHCI
jgi:hypothetical protein